MDLSLENIIENYRRNTPSEKNEKIEYSETKESNHNRLDQWIEFFNNQEIGELPVSWNNVDTPTGKSWGGNVTLQDTVRRIKKVLDLDSPKNLHKASEHLQDYIIGLHESYDIINQDQTCELLTLFKTKDSVAYFVDNIKLNDLSKPQNQPKNKEPQAGLEDWEIPPKMEEVSINNKKIQIYAGGLTELGKNTAKEIQLEMLKTVYDTNIGMAENAYKSIEDNLLKDIAKEKGGRKIVKQIKILNEKEPLNDALENKKGRFSQNTQNTQNGEWEQYKTWFNKTTDFGKRELSDKDLEDINTLFYTSFKESQIAAAQRILDLKENLQKSNKSKDKSLEDIEM